jgi:hypothetical protein
MITFHAAGSKVERSVWFRAIIEPIKNRTQGLLFWLQNYCCRGEVYGQ